MLPNHNAIDKKRSILLGSEGTPLFQDPQPESEPNFAHTACFHFHIYVRGAPSVWTHEEFTTDDCIHNTYLDHQIRTCGKVWMHGHVYLHKPLPLCNDEHLFHDPQTCNGVHLRDPETQWNIIGAVRGVPEPTPPQHYVMHAEPYEQLSATSWKYLWCSFQLWRRDDPGDTSSPHFNAWNCIPNDTLRYHLKMSSKYTMIDNDGREHNYVKPAVLCTEAHAGSCSKTCEKGIHLDPNQLNEVQWNWVRHILSNTAGRKDASS